MGSIHGFRLLSNNHDLIDIMATETSTRYISIVYNFLSQLARPVENRESICQPAFLWVAAYRWNGSDRDVQYRVITVLRYLIRDCPPAVRNMLLSAPTTIPHFIAVVSTTVGDSELVQPKEGLELHDGANASDRHAKQLFNAYTFQRQREVPDSTDQPENPSETGQPDKMAKPRGTYFSEMLKLYMASDDSLVKAEITKVVLEICRCFPLLEPSERASFVQHEDFATPLVHLIVGNGEPALRAQAYLAMVLMAREHTGRPPVQTIMKRKDIFEQIFRDIAGTDTIPEAIKAMPENTSVEQWDTVLRSVRENAKWLVKDMLEDPVSRFSLRYTVL